MATGKRRRTSSESPPTSFSTLPNDLALNILARISRIHYPTLSFVSKSFRSLISSRELDVTRTLIEKTENCFYLCLKHPRKKKLEKSPWFIVTKQQELKAIPPFPYQPHPDYSPSIVSTGSEIYMIGGYIAYKRGCRLRRSRRVFVLDCKSHQWRRLPDMLFPRGKSAGGFSNGKIYVYGGCRTPCNENWGESYDPKIQSWEPLSPTKLKPDFRFQICLMVSNTCFVGDKNIWCRAWESRESRCLEWCDFDDNMGWKEVKGLEGLSKYTRFQAVTNSNQGRRVIAWWFRTRYHPRTPDIGTHSPWGTEIWCAEISFERRSREELSGILKCSKLIYTMDYSKLGRLFCRLAFATVTH